MDRNTWDAVVIGAGAAGLSAAQALGRSLRRTLVIDAGSPRNRFAAHMHNVLGHDGVPPSKLAARGRAEAERYGVEFREGSVLERTVAAVRDGSDAVEVEVELASGELLSARALVVATGVSDVLPELPGLAEHWGTGVLHCPYCHGWEVRGERIAVVTTSPMGIHQARMLRQWTDRLTVFTAGMGEVDETAAREFAARGVKLVSEAVTGVAGDGTRVTAVRTADGEEHPCDAVFAVGAMVPGDAFLSGLGLERSETPMGSFVVVDPMGRTSHPRVWAAGNVVNAGASVPMAMGAGTMAGAAANAALVDEDFALAVGESMPVAHDPAPHRDASVGHDPAHVPGHDPEDAQQDPAEFWEQRYAGSGPVWSGRVNRTLADAVGELLPGRSLDLGCGEGGDVVWLAERGWRAMGIDLSPTAVERAREAAEGRGILGGRIRFAVADLADWAEDPQAIDGSPEPFDLITASFLQSPVELPRETVLRAALSRLAPGGRLVLLSHAAPPPWAIGHAGGPHHFHSPESELSVLGLDGGEASPGFGASEFEVLVAERRLRDAIGPDGETGELEDSLVVVRRRA